MTKKELQQMPLADLKALFESKRKELLALRDEIDKRETRPVVPFDFEQYITK